MPWFKCSHCRIRRSGLDVAISPAQDTCPLCGGQLDVERELTALVGFRFLTSEGSLVERGAHPTPLGTAGLTIGAGVLAAERRPGGDRPRRRSP